MPECEITFTKRFFYRDDQDPASIGKVYIESMGFKVIEVRVVDPLVPKRIPCDQCDGQGVLRYYDSDNKLCPKCRGSKVISL